VVACAVHLEDCQRRVRWRGPAPTAQDAKRAYFQLGRYLGVLADEVQRARSIEARRYLTKARAAYAKADPESGWRRGASTGRSTRARQALRCGDCPKKQAFSSFPSNGYVFPFPIQGTFL